MHCEQLWSSAMLDTAATSEANPIRVDWVVVGTAGRLGMTFAPGKKDRAGGSAAWDRDIDMDLARLSGHYGVDVLVPLIEEHEMKLLQIPDLLTRAPQHGMAVDHFPLPDMSVPPSMDALHAQVETIIKALENGSNVVVHCRGGLGRAGLVAACVLVRLGLRPQSAVEDTRGARPGAIQTREQEQFVHLYSLHLDRQPAS